MSYVIAVTGKGGTGKTTVAALLVRELIARGATPVLAVDADPNTCLDAALGVRAEKTVGRVREEARQEAGKGLGAGVSKQQLLELKIAQSLVEADDFDLIAMGRSEGPGCYCYANNVLKQVLGTLSARYPYVVLDNEAGLENLSRRIVQKADLMIMITDPSKRGFETVRRLHELAAEMGTGYAKLSLMVNRMHDDSSLQRAREVGAAIGADYVAGLPEDGELARRAEQGGSLLDIGPSNQACAGLRALLTGLGVVPCAQEHQA
ncbi:MAG: AAA family ATPase [Chitinivibrionales bacterium]|nr:AAA family ATPase [Chitinivibrionales bacterium]MBD3394982.1 AAA family ATPase [Chitinivibrionales bacterium]